MQNARADVPLRTVLLFSLLSLVAVGWLVPTSAEAETPKPLSFDSRSGLAAMEEVAVKVMGPVDAVALRAEDAAKAANREHYARWLTTGGPVSPSLLYELSDAQREIFGEWLLTGGPVPAAVLERLPRERRQAFEGSALDAGRQIPEALLEELRGLGRLFERKPRVGFAMQALTRLPRQQSLSPANSGSWEDLPGGGQVWRLRVRSPDARWLVLGFQTFRPLRGARLYVFDRDRETLLGPFTSTDVSEHRQLWMEPVDGDEVVIELFWPEGLRGITPDIVLGTVSHGYKNAWDPEIELGADGPDTDPSVDGSASCHVDIACEPTWHKEKRGVAYLLIQGAFLCSGSLINNTAENCDRYVLTARHCVGSSSEASGTLFRFNWERSQCGSGTGPVSHVRSGSSLRATRSFTDFSLLEINNSLLGAWELYFNGWNRADTPAPEATNIHHPAGDYKKISFEFDQLVFGQVGGWGADHWRVLDWEIGSTEGGSSGSPLFDSTDPVGSTPKIVGQLHGGPAVCGNNGWDEYGRFDLSFTGGASPSSRLRDWLDPEGTDQMTLDGKDHSVCLDPFPNFVVDDWVVLDYRGNGDGYADPGEAIELQLTLLNTGHMEATRVEGELSTVAVDVVIPGDAGEWPDLVPGASANSEAPHFDLQIDPAYPCDAGTQVVPLSLLVDNAQSFLPRVVEFELQLGAPVPAPVFFDDLEPTFEPGWIYFSPSGASWELNDSADPNDSTSPTHAWFVENGLEEAQAPLIMPSQPPGGGTLAARARLRFQHRFLTEDDTDGGVLEYSLDGTTWRDINYDPSTGLSKDRFLANGYNGTISSLGNRPAWEGDSGGWMQVEVDLSDFEGEELLLRYLFASDDGNTGEVEGWYVDDVTVEYIEFDCTAHIEAPAAISELLLGMTPDGNVTFAWQPPPVSEGGAIMRYLLQETPLGPVAPQYVMDLGPLPYAEVDAAALTDGGFLIVGENSLGTGPTGNDSDGNPRPPAEPTP